MIPLGYEATMADRARLAAYAEPESVYRAWKLGHDATKPPLPVIDAIEIDPVPEVDPRRISYLVKTKAGEVLDTKVLGSDLKRIYSMGIFEIVSYAIIPEGDRNILRITPTLKSWGPTFLKLGLFLGTDFQLVTQFDVVALIDATQLNSLGGEWKTLVKIGTPLAVETRFFQPLNYEGRIFLSPLRRLAPGPHPRLRRGGGRARHLPGVAGSGRDGSRLRLRDGGGAARRLRAGLRQGAAEGRRRDFSRAGLGRGRVHCASGGRSARQRERAARRLFRLRRLPRQPREPRRHGVLRSFLDRRPRRADDRAVDRAAQGRGRHGHGKGDPVLRRFPARRSLPALRTASPGKSGETSTSSRRRCSTTA